MCRWLAAPGRCPPGSIHLELLTQLKARESQDAHGGNEQNFLKHAMSPATVEEGGAPRTGRYFEFARVRDLRLES